VIPPYDGSNGFRLGGDTVAVPVRWHLSVGNGDAADGSTKEDDPKEAKRQHLRDCIAQMMQSDRCELPSLIDQAQREFGIAKTTARNRIMKAIRNECGSLAQANGVSYRLTVEREKPSPPNPVFVIRTAFGEDDEIGAVEGVASIAPDAAAIEDEASVDDIDAPASLVSA
jgi:hypothetical protein